MNIRKTAISFVAAAGLALSLTGGAIAQEPDDEAATTVELAGGACTGTIESEQVNLGTFTFDGENFIPDEGSGSATFTLSIDDNTVANESCSIELVANPLKAEGVALTIDVYLSAPEIANATMINVPASKGSSVTITASIISTLGEVMVPAIYTGNITVTGSASGG